MRQGDGVTALVEPLLSVITRLHGVGEATVDLLAPDAPAAVKDEAVIRYASYLYDTPSGTSGDRYAASWRNSGAGALVAGWVVRRVAESVAATSSDGGGGVSETRISQLIEAALLVHTDIVAAHHTPSTGGILDTDAVKALIQAWAQAGNDDLMPAAKYRAPTTTARGAALAAATDDVDENPGARLTTFLSYTVTQLKRFINRVVRPYALDGGRLILPSDLLATVTNSRLVKIGATGLFELVAEAPGSPGEPIVDVVDGRLPAAAVAMRLGWSQSRVFVEGTFIRANNHPIDGAADGTTLGLNVPPFPPALASDSSLYLGIWLAGDPDLQAIDRTATVGENSLAFFPAADRQALTIDSVAGYYYPANSREFPPSDDVLSVTLGGGPLIALANDLALLQLDVDALGNMIPGATAVLRYELIGRTTNYTDHPTNPEFRIPYPEGVTHLMLGDSYVVGHLRAPTGYVGATILDGADAWPLTPINSSHLQSAGDTNAEVQVSWEETYVRVVLRNFGSIPVADQFPWQLSLTVM